MSSFAFILLLAISATLFKLSNTQFQVPIEMHKNERRVLTETQWEIVKQLSSHPHFIYSEFMETRLNSAMKERTPLQCLLDTQQLIRDLLSLKQYSLLSKFCLMYIHFWSLETSIIPK